jgi:hypothetical protein
VTAIDFTNTFGSVPHELIMSTMKQLNFSEWSRKIISDIYDRAVSVIEVRGSRTDKIEWKRSVKQGCPLSPLLFNLCLEPLLQAMTRQCQRYGAFVGWPGNQIEFPVQAYADKIIFISKKVEEVRKMLGVFEQFVDWSKIEVNVKKCTTASYLIDGNRHRCSFRESRMFKNQGIPNRTLAQSLKYLGTAVAARRQVKWKQLKRS